MKIVLVQDFLRVGGTERQTVALANALVAARHDAVVLTFRPGGPLERHLSERVRRQALQPRDFHADWFAPALIRRLKRLHPDVVQLMGRMANSHGWRMADALAGVSIVATVRTGKPIRRLYQLTLRRADAVVANSEHAMQRLAREYAISGPQVHLVRNAVIGATVTEPDARATVRQSMGTRPETLVLLSAAMMHRGKGHEDLIRIVTKLPGSSTWELWLVGDGPQRRSLHRLAEHAQGTNGRVRFLGVRFDLAHLYAAADIAVLASRPDRESLPNFLVEAQWHGLPVIAYDAAGLRETFVPDISGVLVPLDDQEGFARAIDELAANPARREAMREAAQVHARREFDPLRQHQCYLDLYARLRSEQTTQP